MRRKNIFGTALMWLSCTTQYWAWRITGRKKIHDSAYKDTIDTMAFGCGSSSVRFENKMMRLHRQEICALKYESLFRRMK